MKVKAIIFDMDGVLIDSEQMHIQSGMDVLGKLGVKLTQEDIEQLLGMTDMDAYGYVIKKYGIAKKPMDLGDEREGIYLKMAEESLGTFPNATWLLKQLFGKYTLALTTSGSLLTVNQMFQRFGWKKYFKVVVTREDVRNGKPDPEPYIKTIQMLGLKPSECIVVEDSLHGIESAKAAGAMVIAVTHTIPEEQIAQHTVKPDQIAHNLKEVLEKLPN